MKNRLLKLALTCCTLALLFSCQKEEDEQAPAPQAVAKTAGMEYGPQNCELPNGACGSQCAGNDGGCWTATECKGNSNYYMSVLTALYSPAEVEAMMRDNASITNTQLLNILKSENILPLK